LLNTQINWEQQLQTGSGDNVPFGEDPALKLETPVLWILVLYKVSCVFVPPFYAEVRICAVGQPVVIMQGVVGCKSASLPSDFKSGVGHFIVKANRLN